MLSHYISDIYVSFRNTRYNTSSILNVMIMIDYKCKTLYKTKTTTTVTSVNTSSFFGNCNEGFDT